MKTLSATYVRQVDISNKTRVVGIRSQMKKKKNDDFDYRFLTQDH